MPDANDCFARSLHHLTRKVRPGEPFEPSIVPASIYHLAGEPSGRYQYGRWTNPTWDALEEALAIIEDAGAVIFPSGMAAIAALLYSHLKPGDRLLLPSDGYYSTRAWAEKYLVPFGVNVDTCATVDFPARDLTGYRLVWVETPSNPGLHICDIRAVAEKARQAGALLVADNTTMTPLGQRPLDLGADAVVYSDTKAMSGHSDVIFGHVASRNAELLAAVGDWRKLSGAIPGQFEAWLLHRSLQTLEVRFDRMCRNAEIIAGRLEEFTAKRAPDKAPEQSPQPAAEHSAQPQKRATEPSLREEIAGGGPRKGDEAVPPAARSANAPKPDSGHRLVQRVQYPGLASHPAHAIAKAQMLRYGVMIGLTLADKDSAERFINSCEFIRPSTSFGGAHTSAERRARWGEDVDQGFIRLSIGCEPTEQLWKAIQEALAVA